jgi:3D (Asp-Asp-Asp) domain-containing protein
MPFTLFYSKNNKNRQKKLFQTVNFMILLSLAVNFSFPQMTIAQDIEVNTNKITIINAFSTDKPDLRTFGDIRKEKIINKTVIKYTRYILVTAYSSTVDQCDSTPFITANGTRVHDGIIAANSLRFGTKVRFPEYSKDKIYTVEDRMHARFNKRADIWMETRQQAQQFGAQWLKMEVLY